MHAHWLGADSSKWIDIALEPLKSESRSEVLNRARTLFDRLACPNNSSIVLFGVGALGKATLKGLRVAGIAPVAISDNNPQLWGKEIDGIRIYSPTEAVSRWGSKATFVVTIYNGSSIREQLKSANCKWAIPFAPLYWKYAEVFIPDSCLGLPHMIWDHEESIRAAFAILGDDASRREYCQQIRWRFLLDYSALSPALDYKTMYYPNDLVKPSDNEVLVDCGAYDGDSIRGYLEVRGTKFNRIYAVEPDISNRKALQAFLTKLPQDISSKISVLPFAVGDKSERILFSATSDVCSSMVSGELSQVIECRSLDELEFDMAPTYIKMDIEAAEPAAIRGSKKLITTNTPIFAACIYHRSEHLWEIPLLLRQSSEEYNIFIRRYAEECWEMVCYAVPNSRLSRQCII
ncbi:MAG: FkbM family methyltransferase [Proteobacteria bacterium]|nr:FkbM family methyltransferase [Pseudomonadota bacterium]